MRKTYSICPVCMKKISAEYFVRGDGVYLEKTCPEHGKFSTMVWRGQIEKWLKMDGWQSDNNDSCPFTCGLCSLHRQNTCCIEVEVTSRCNLHCAYCFEDGISKEPTVDELYELFKKFVAEKRTFLHISGGEPTVRDDLPEIVAAAKKAGMQYVQLNSNGVRLAENENLVRKLADAGVSFVFLQFDGTNDEIYMKTRGEALLEKKKKAIENCSKYKLGVSLVPTLVPGVNIDNIGDIIKFAISMSPAVRGVHFQPVSYFGRYPKAPENDMRFTLPELIEEIHLQSGIEPECFAQSGCDHPMCGFHGDFVVMPDGLMPLTKGHNEVSASACCCGSGEQEKSSCCEETENDNSCCTETVSCCEASAEISSCCCTESEPEKTECCCTEAEEKCCDANAEAASCCCCESTAEETVNCCGGEADTECDDNAGHSECCCGAPVVNPLESMEAVEKNRKFVARRWLRDAVAEEETDVDVTSIDGFLSRLKSHGFTITSMAFQDAYNVDVERLKHCSLHIYADGKIMPFCLRYILR